VFQINEKGEMTTPHKEMWDDIYDDRIHLYAIKPLIDAGNAFRRKDYLDKARLSLKRYLNKKDLLEFNTRLHFYMYILEGLFELQQFKMCEFGYKQLIEIYNFKRMISAYPRKSWVCSCGLAQFSLLGYKLGYLSQAEGAYKKIGKKIVLYAGHICGPENHKLNIYWQNRLNNLGQMLKTKDIHLCFVGLGLNDKLKSEWVTSLGPVSIKKFWDYQYWANCGIVLASGKDQHNEKSKIYYYLRTGLPVVSESPVPNNDLIMKAQLGYISPYNNDAKMAVLIEKAVNRQWNKKRAINYILKNHTWERRVEIYDQFIKNIFYENK